MYDPQRGDDLSGKRERDREHHRDVDHAERHSTLGATAGAI
jgi:hypothetical protein